MAERARRAAEKRPAPEPASEPGSHPGESPAAEAAGAGEPTLAAHATEMTAPDREPDAEVIATAGAAEPGEAAVSPDQQPVALRSITASQTETLQTFEQRIKEISDRLNASKPIGRRGLSSRDEVDLAVTEIRRHQAGLATQTAVGRAMEARASDATVRGYTDTLAAMRADLARIMGHVESAGPAGSGAPVAELRQEVVELRQSLHHVASREDVARVESSVEALARTFEAPGGIVPLAPYSRELEALRAEIQRLSETHERGEGASVARNLDVVSHKIDMLIAGGLDAQVLGAMAQQVEDLRDGVARSATADDVNAVAHQVAELRTDVAAMVGRQADGTDLSSLREAVQEVRDVLDRSTLAAAPGGAREAVRDELQPIEALLATLVEKVDRVEQRRADPVALDQLETHLSALNASFRAGAGDGSLRALEQAMSDLLNEVATWRQGTIEVAERAARSAVAETLEASPPGADGRNSALASRTQEKLDGVQTTLSDVVKRLGELEAFGQDRRAAERSLPVAADLVAVPAPRVEAERMAEGAPAAPAPALSAPTPKSDVAAWAAEGLDEADQPLKPAQDEILLEPGAKRPLAGGPASVDEIKTSFITAARRAAQAAAAESQRARQTEQPKIATAGLVPLAARARALFESHRRQLLIGAAALALAIGVFQLVGEFGGGKEEARTLSQAPVSASTPRATSPASADPTTTQSVTLVPADPAPAAAPASATPALPDAAIPAEPPAREVADAKSAGPVSTAALPDAAKPAGVDAKPSDGGDGLGQAAAAGNPQAEYELASRMSEGRGLPRNPQAAASLMEKAAEKGLAPAQYRLANLYEKGNGVGRNLDTAKTWYRKAAEGGNIRAMHNLAVLMAEGSEGKPDYAGAVGWFQRAAEFGVRDSQYNLAVLYARGLGVGQDLGKSYTWFALAAAQGDTDAAKKRDEVAVRLPAADLARVKAAVEKWRPAPASTAANEVTVPTGGWGGETAPKTRGTTG